MRRLGGLALLLELGCRAKAAPSGALAAIVVDAGAEGSVLAPAEGPRFTRPLTALRANGVTSVIARDRASDRLRWAALSDDATSPSAGGLLDLAVRADEALELVASSGHLGLLLREGDTRVLRRVTTGIDGGAALTTAVPLGNATCATSQGVYSLRRDGSGWKGTFHTLEGEGTESPGPVLASRADATLVCGQRRAFVVTVVDGRPSVLAWSPETHDAKPTVLPAMSSPAGDDDLSMAAMDDQLVIARLEKGALSTLVWSPGGAASAWRKAVLPERAEIALEAIEPARGVLGVLTVRTAPAKDCRTRDATDAIAEAAMVDMSSGQLLRAPERVEIWRCGAEPGPFSTGWADEKWVVSWPKGADAACVRAGVRHGGIGYAAISTSGARARVGQIAKPAEAVVSAGCDGHRCYAIALTRGGDACGAADAGVAGQLELAVFPP